MSFKMKLTKVLESLLEGAEKPTKSFEAHKEILVNVSEQESNKQSKEFESLINALNLKVSILIDKVEHLNEDVINCTTLTEELLYTIDQFQDYSDKPSNITLHSDEKKKYELN